MVPLVANSIRLLNNGSVPLCLCDDTVKMKFSYSASVTTVYRHIQLCCSIHGWDMPKLPLYNSMVNVSVF